MRITKILIISVIFLSGVSCSGDKLIPEPEQHVKHVLPNAGLKDLVGIIRPDFLFGSFADGLTSPDKSRLRDIFRKEFSIITIGVYMKPLQPQSGVYNFTAVDDLVYFSQANDIVIYMHPLIGGYQYTADWVQYGNFTADQLKQIMKERIETILTRYTGKVKYVDVVNEALIGSDPSGTILWRTDKNVWIKMGWHDDVDGRWPLYLEEAFRIAREAGGSSVKLIYNDNLNAMMDSKRTQATIRLYNDFKNAGIPVDGIGLQFHCGVKYGQLREGSSGDGLVIDFDSFVQNLRRFGENGIEVHITEFDVHLPENPTVNDYEMQAMAYREALKRCLEEPACKSFKSWGFTDKYAWKPLNYNAHQLIYDEEFNQKRAYMEIRKMLEEKVLEIDSSYLSK